MNARSEMEISMRCKKCGRVLYAGQIKCESCGTFVEEEDVSTEETVVLEYIDITTELDKKELKSIAKTESFTDTEIELIDEDDEDYIEEYEDVVDMDLSDDFDSVKVRRKRKKGKSNYVIAIVLTVAFVAVVMILLSMVKSLYEDSYDFNYNKAVSLYNEKNYADSIPYFEKAISLTNAKEVDQLIVLNMCLYDCYYDSGDVNKAIETLNKVLVLDPNYVEALDSLAEVYYASGNGVKLNELMSKYKAKDGYARLAKYMVNTPVVNIEAGSYSENISLEFTSDIGTKIYYTMDGTIPTALSNELTGALLLEEGSHEVKVIAINNIGVTSDVIGLTYFISYERPSAPVISVASGQYTSEKTIEVGNIPEGGKAYYIWDSVAHNTLTDDFVEYDPEEKIEMKNGQHILSVIVKNRYDLTSVVSTRAYILELPAKYTYSQAVNMLKSDLIEKGILKNGGNETQAGKVVNFVYRTKKTIGEHTLYIIWYELDGQRQTYMYGVDTRTAEVFTVTLSNGLYKIQE